MIRLRTLAAGVAGAWLAWRIAGPETTPRYLPRQERPLRLPGRSVFVGEREFFVRETGPEDAPTIVLIHGWSLDGEMTFHRIVPDLQKRFRLVIPDLRNHGRSDWIRSGFSIDDLAADVAGVLDAVGVRQATVVGYSLGGMVAQVLAISYPRFVSRLVLAGTAARPIDQLRVVAWLGMRTTRAIARISRYELSYATTTIVRRSGGIGSEHVRWMWEGLMRRDPALFYEAGFAAWRFDNRKAVGRIDVPTMVIIPTSDQVVPARTQHELASLLDGPEVVELRGARHESILSDPAAYIEAIGRFAAG
jgi:pimeloyl-ACP methyl ester carboxylesterase